MPRYNVHIYAIARLKIAGVEIVGVGVLHASSQFVERQPGIPIRLGLARRLQQAAESRHGGLVIAQFAIHFGRLQQRRQSLGLLAGDLCNATKLLDGRWQLAEPPVGDAQQVLGLGRALVLRRVVPAVVRAAVQDARAAGRAARAP